MADRNHGGEVRARTQAALPRRGNDNSGGLTAGMDVRMNTVIADMTEGIDEAMMHRAGEILRDGGLVAFPTETVYGLGADAMDAEASKKIYAAKGRPSDNPLIVHIARMEDLPACAAYIPESARKLAAAYWPGPLTMIFRKSERVPLSTTGGLTTVAVRMPSHPVAQRLILEGGGFIAAPSANTSGRPSPSTAAHVRDDLDGKIDMIIDGGPVDIGIESTIVDLTEDVPMVLRPGYISLEMLRQTLGEVRMDPGLGSADPSFRPKAPGMKYRHYAPRADMTIVEGDEERAREMIRALAAKACAEGKKVGILACEESAGTYPDGIVRAAGSRQDEVTIAAGLYAVLREFDDLGVDIIYSEAFDTPRIGQAVMNRLVKAAGRQILYADGPSDGASDGRQAGDADGASGPRQSGHADAVPGGASGRGESSETL